MNYFFAAITSTDSHSVQDIKGAAIFRSVSDYNSNTKNQKTKMFKTFATALLIAATSVDAVTLKAHLENLATSQIEASRAMNKKAMMAYLEDPNNQTWAHDDWKVTCSSKPAQYFV